MLYRRGDIMRMVLLQTVGLLITSVLYCLVIPQARAMVMGDGSLAEKAVFVGIRGVCIYVCFLFVYYAFLQNGKKRNMPDQGAYGGYSEDAPDESDES